MTTQIEQLLGIKFDRERSSIPGTTQNKTRKYIYIEDDGRGNFGDLFNSITAKVIPRNATHGGMGEVGFRIITPDNTVFHGLSYKGDLEGWKQDIELGSKNLNLLIATIEDDKMVISDGRSYKLFDCQTEDDLKLGVKDKVIKEEQKQAREAKEIISRISVLYEMAMDLLEGTEQKLAIEAIDQFKEAVEKKPSMVYEFDSVMYEVLKNNNLKETKTISSFLDYISEMLSIMISDSN